ncbi:MAG: dienelactone hydrolase family protein [Pseudomonadota bacterium]
MKRGLIAAGIAMALALAAIGANLRPFVLGAAALLTPKASLATLEARVAEQMTVRTPTDASPPYPAVIQFHGCGGMWPGHMAAWAEVVNAAGFMAIAVDSLAARDIPRAQASQTVCAGRELLGQERAGDVLAALRLVQARPDVDPDNVVLMGWSHGAWSIMDFLTMDLERARPAQLGPLTADERPAAPPAGLVLFYPYCGFAARSAFQAWTGNPPTLALLAGADTWVDTPACERVLEDVRSGGTDVEIAFFPGAEHEFENPAIDEEFPGIYDPDAAAKAQTDVATFLNALRGAE